MAILTGMRATRLIIACASLFIASAAAASAADKPKAPARVTAEIYVMSHCPYGMQAENAFLPVLKQYKDHADFNIYFIAGLPDAAAEPAQLINSMHGPKEAEEDFRQVCALAQDKTKALDYILGRNKAIKSEDWQSAAKAAGLDPAAITACMAGTDGAKLLVDNVKAAQNRKASSSPTVYLGGKIYSGARTAAGFEWDLCSALKAKGVELPASCAAALAAPRPAADAKGKAGCGNNSPKPFNITIVTDKTCPVCEPGLQTTMAALHPAAKIAIEDYRSPQGQALLARHGFNTLPLYVLDKAVEQEADFKDNLASFYSVSGGSYIVRPGPRTYYPALRLERKPAPRHADIFVEPNAPEAAQMTLDLLRFIAANGASIKDLGLSWHFIVQQAPTDDQQAVASASGRKADLSSAAPTKLVSARGDEEVREALRQACIFQHQSFTAFAVYLRCRYFDAADASRAERCLPDSAAVKACVAGGEGEALLKADAALEAGFGVMPAPVALLWENRYGPFAWNAVDWESLFK
jgi:hypothetical protein